MGTPSSATEVKGTQSQKMLQIVALFAAFATSFGAPGYGHIGYHPAPCVKELETIKATACKLVPEKTCSTETVKIGEKLLGLRKASAKRLRSASLCMDIIMVTTAKEKLKLSPATCMHLVRRSRKRFASLFL